MRLHEAKDYFRTVGTLYREQKKQSPSAGLDFMQEEKATAEFQTAFMVARLLSTKNNPAKTNEDANRHDVILLDDFRRLNWMVSQHASPSKEREWRKLTRTHNAIKETRDEVDIVVAVYQRRKEFSSVAITIGNSVVGLNLGLLQTSDEMRKIAATLPQAEKALSIVDVICTVAASSFIVKQNGKSLAEFASTNFKKPVDSTLVADYAEMLFRFVNAAYNFDRDALELDHTQPLFQQYPYLTRNAVVEAGHIAASMFYLRPAHIQVSLDSTRKALEKGDKDGTYRAAVKRSIDFYHNVDAFKETIKKALFSPANPHASSLRDVFTFYLQHENPGVVNYALSLIGVHSEATLKNAYRQAEAFVQQGVNPKFYQLLAEKLKRLAQISQRINTPLVEDLELTLQQEQKPQKAPSYSELKNLISAIVRLPSWRTIIADNINIDWNTTGLKAPTAWTLIIDPVHPFSFSVRLQYHNEGDENLTYTFSIDTTKQTFDWSALESPDTNTDLQQNYLSFAHVLLSNLYSQANDQERKKTTSMQTVFSLTREERIQRYQPSIKQKESGAVTKEEELFNMADLHEAKEKIITEVEPPDDTVFAELQGVSPVIINAIKQGIEDVIDGTEIPLPLKSRGPQGQKQFKVRVGDYRIIFWGKEFTTGKRVLEVGKIKHRKDVYR